MTAKKKRFYLSDNQLFISILVIIFYAIYAILFDMTVTYTVYKWQPSTFYAREANQLFVWGVKHNFPLMLNPSVLTNYLYVYLYIAISQRFLKTKKWMIFLAATFMIIFLSASHIMGGLSWW